MVNEKKRTKIQVKRLQDGDITVTVRLIGYHPTVISALASDITQRSRTALGRTLGSQLGHDVIRAFMKKEGEPS